MYGAVRDDLTTRLEELRDQGLYKHELTMTTPQGAHVDVQGRGELRQPLREQLPRPREPPGDGRGGP